MYTLFKTRPETYRSSQLPGTWHNLHSEITRQVDKIIHFYQTTPIAVKADHVLNTILGYYGSMHEASAFDVYRRAASSYLGFCTSNKLTSSASVGQIYQGVFYGPGIKEILIGVNEPFNYNVGLNDWKSIVPLKVLYHPFSNTVFNIPNGLNPTTVKGYSVIQIDIPKLVVKYHWFRRWEREVAQVENPDYVSKTPFQFIHMHVLPLMMYSHADNVIINRFKAIFMDEEIEDSPSLHSFYVTRWGLRLDRVFLSLKESLSGKAYDFGTMLRSIPTIYSTNAYEFSILPSVYITRQVEWALVMGRMHLYELLFAIDDTSDTQTNASYTHHIQNMIERYRINGLIKSVTPRLVRNDLERSLDKLYTHKRF